MEHEHIIEEELHPPKSEEMKGEGWLARNTVVVASAMISVGMIASAFVLAAGRGALPWGNKPSATPSGAETQNQGAAKVSALQEEVAPSEGVTLPAIWGNLGQQMVQAGVIDETQFKALYAQQGGLSPDMAAMLDGSNNGRIKITPQNAGILLNMLWALGLGNKNPILTSGPMENPQYGGAQNFASTGGWTLAAGNVMNHYAAHAFVILTPEQQSLVVSVAQNIYRPCCGNSTLFPDCNHGMAMLGLLELMASQGATTDQMYKAALAVNSYWFPDTYMTIANYFASKGMVWGAVDPKTALGAQYSSAQGYQSIAAYATPAPVQSGGGCNVQ